MIGRTLSHYRVLFFTLTEHESDIWVMDLEPEN